MNFLIRFTFKRAIDTDAPPVYRYGVNPSDRISGGFTTFLQGEAKKFPRTPSAVRWLKSRGLITQDTAREAWTEPINPDNPAAGIYSRWEIILA